METRQDNHNPQTRKGRQTTCWPSIDLIAKHTGQSIRETDPESSSTLPKEPYKTRTIWFPPWPQHHNTTWQDHRWNLNQLKQKDKNDHSMHRHLKSIRQSLAARSNNKLIQLKIPTQLLKLLESLLLHRTFKVRINNTSTSARPILAGAHQGSCLSPQLFYAYINDMPQHKDYKTTLFADDTMFYAFGPNTNCLFINGKLKKVIYGLFVIETGTIELLIFDDTSVSYKYIRISCLCHITKFMYRCTFYYTI